MRQNLEHLVAGNPDLDEEAEPASIAPRIQGALGRALRSHYDDLVSAPIPDRFLVLLSQLAAKEKGDE